MRCRDRGSREGEEFGGFVDGGREPRVPILVWWEGIIVGCMMELKGRGVEGAEDKGEGR